MILVSNDAALLASFESAVSEHDRLVVAATDEELRAALASTAETVVMDVPAADRLQAWHRVRALHAGVVLVVVDSQSETQDWPSDLARRFLVRPLVVDQIVTALAVRPKILREPAAARRRRLAQARRPPVVPPPITAPEPPPGGVEPVRRLSTEENLWGETRPEPATPPAAAEPAEPAEPAAPAEPPAPAALPAPGPEAPDAGQPAAGAEPDTGTEPLVAGPVAPVPPVPPAAPAAPAALDPPGRTPAADRTAAAGGREPPLRAYRRVGLVAAGIVLLLLTTAGGIAIGRATANTGADTPRTATRSSTPGSSAPTTAPSVVIREKTPAACDAALADADAAVWYLIGNIRDERLTRSMQSYQANRRACREASR